MSSFFRVAGIRLGGAIFIAQLECPLSEVRAFGGDERLC